MDKNANHLFVTEMESAGQNLQFTVDEKSLLLDLKVLIKEYYSATFSENGNSLLLKFTNGQTFLLSVNEVK